MSKIIKSFLALTLSFIIAIQNVMIIVNAEETQLTEDTWESPINETVTNNNEEDKEPRLKSQFNMGNNISRSSNTKHIEQPTNNILKAISNPNAIGVGNVTSATLNVRKGPESSYAILGTLKKSDTIEVLSKEKNWYKILYNNEFGYISSSYISLNPIEKGIDVSKWNKNIDWNKVKEAGIDYVIIRAGSSYSSKYGYGYPSEDVQFKSHIEGAAKVGLKVGVYYFSYGLNTNDAKKEAEKCLSILQPYKDMISYPVFFDYEYHSIEKAKERGVTPTKNLVSDMTDVFLDTISAHGYNTGIYTNLDFSRNYYTDDILYNNYLWIAQYSNQCTFPKPYSMWQYTDKGAINGISGNFDMNYTYLKYSPDEEEEEFISLENTTVDSISSQTYTGDNLIPSVKVVYNNNPLTLNTDYKVTYYNNKSVGNASVEITGIGKYKGSKTVTFKIMPRKVTNIKSSNKSNSSINLSWNSVDDITGYRIYKYDEKTKSYKYLSNTTNQITNYTDSNLKSNTKYSYKVRAYKTIDKENFYGSYSDVLSITTNTTPQVSKPSKVTGLKLSSTSTNALKISWSKKSNISGYKIYKYSTSSKKYKLVKTIYNSSTTSFTDEKLSSATNYSYKIKSFKKIDTKEYLSDYSSVLTGTTKPLTPKLSLKTSSKKITASWSNISTRSTGYRIYMSTSKNGKYTLLKSTSSRSYTKTNLKKGRTYYFKVRAYRTVNDSNIYGSYSSVKSIICK